MNEFSIVIPTINGISTGLKYAVESVRRQTYPHWELIIVDGGSNDGTQDYLKELAKEDERIKIVLRPINQNPQRVANRNEGMKAATKDWICWLDHDDEYLKTYLEVLNSYMTEDYPGYKCYHYGAVLIRMGFQNTRETFNLKEEGEGMEQFQSGHVGTGSFCFHRDCLELGYLPDVINPYLFADAAKEEFPEFAEWYGPTPTIKTPNSKTLGNPWGDDYYMFYKITRKFKSKGLPIAPYLQFVRRQGFSFQPIP